MSRGGCGLASAIKSSAVLGVIISSTTISGEGFFTVEGTEPAGYRSIPSEIERSSFSGRGEGQRPRLISASEGNISAPESPRYRIPPANRTRVAFRSPSGIVSGIVAVFFRS